MENQLWRTTSVLRSTSRKRLRNRLAKGQVVRARRGVYADGPIEDLDALRALLLCLPSEAMLSRHTAARLHGFGVLPEGAVHVQLPPEVPRPRLPGVVVHHSAVPVEPVLVRGLPCAPAPRCAVDLARTVRRLDALPVLDAVLRAGVVSRDGLVEEVLSHGGLPGVRQARSLVPLADGRAECRQESQLRLVLIDGGLPVPEPQVWVLDEDGARRYRLDLGYRRRRIGIEYDGLSHLDRERLRYDRDRANWLASEGWTMRHFTDRDLYRRPAHIVTTIRALLP
ncbi:DUF559 domain-containing protein [Micromonospora carbonacea]|uniref:DUF559 domain-containing protein n=1 Tax=Micromonospora carbonacea TaxID=47853 RepID=A0A7H8XG45_9ACTN|nr:DUF559 domain-containing protein [Micromonospora carbonacea]MBB5828636.1 hypothetical protein [Micromonospora carbonacea]QLD23785.1 DUF559 domain-containing protein [Micromonospora carbonacea]